MPINHYQAWDIDGNLVIDEVLEIPYPSLDPAGVAATLNVVLGLWSLQDAANAIGVEPDHLVAEAQAWAMG